MFETVHRLTEYPWLIHGFSTRLGGVSQPPHTSLNISFSRPDDPHAVLENRRRLAAALGFQLHDVVVAAQVHGTTVTSVLPEHRGRGAFSADTVLPPSDALITDQPGLVLWGSFADCTPVLFVDPVRHVVGLAHAGWQGTVGDIVGATVTALQDNFACQPAELLAVIGPAIGPCCYEVGEPVISQVCERFPAQADDLLLRAPGRERPHLDLWRANALLLERAGLHPERIITMQVCTACQVERFFSHRREQGATGRFAAVIGIRRPEELNAHDC